MRDWKRIWTAAPVRQPGRFTEGKILVSVSQVIQHHKALPFIRAYNMNSRRDIPVIAVIGGKNTGKTTLVEELITALKGEGYRVGVMKYALRKFQIDHEGKDTYRFYQSGADTVGITSMDKMAVIKRITSPPPLNEFLECHFSDTDLVLLEGYKGHECPKIRLTLPGRESSVTETPPREDSCPILNINVSGDTNPISPEVLQEALAFIKRVIRKAG